MFVGTDAAVADGLGFAGFSEEGFYVVASLAGICFDRKGMIPWSA